MTRHLRTTVLAAVVSAAAITLAACGSSSAPAEGASSSASNPADDSSAAPTGGDVEVFTFWTSGGEKAGLDGLAEEFGKQCSDYNFTTAVVAGGAGANANAVLASRLQQNDPPSTFQVHAGAESLSYIAAGQVQGLTDQFKEWGLTEAFPESLIDSMSVDGKVYSVPANIHRVMMWANTSVLEQAGITDEPQTIDDLLTNLQKLRDAGVAAPLAMGVDWTQSDLLEPVLLSVLGGDAYNKLWSSGGEWSLPEVTEALHKYQELLSFTNDDRDSLDWTDAERLLVQGDAGYQVMGDWMAGEMDGAGFTDYSYQAFPGTEDYYMWIADSFTLPTGIDNVAGAECWLKVVGSAEGQKAFNTKKGSIPARVDADPADYPEYQQSAMADFKKLTMVPSCAHGSACTLGQAGAVNSALGKFSGDGDLASLQGALGDAIADNAITL